MPLKMSVGVRRVRVIYSDPYATESSGDEEDNVGGVRSVAESSPRKRVVMEIIMPVVGAGWIEITGGLCGGKKPRRALKCRGGARQRKSGKWAAEIRDPSRHDRPAASEEADSLALEVKQPQFLLPTSLDQEIGLGLEFDSVFKDDDFGKKFSDDILLGNGDGLDLSAADFPDFNFDINLDGADLSMDLENLDFPWMEESLNIAACP